MIRPTLLALALAGFFAGSGCGSTPWVQARSAVATTAAALDVLDGDLVRGLLPDEAADDYDVALVAARGTVELGDELVRAWERHGERPQRWPWWLTQALEWSARVVAIIKGAGVAVPAEVALALGGLQLLLPILVAAAGG